ncbi:acyl-CoA dehydrogenase family protein [Polyangium sp. 6x1]|uniref:acyl-CoA dehydrogenase family protein n=1 Tax=Polyangium sp. 6x1 TaxID=3042689 RepID=UPI00248258E5|nr:acyl-CoA dehydrogenase family protein [Polyangium sp. 6x1]MDI1449796.1 acyl-CoA dehydrogenase family protein [Polyangium sp. 6x1]
MEALQKIIKEIVGPSAIAVDAEGKWPKSAMEALGQAGILGLICAPEVGGRGAGLGAAAEVVEAVSAACASTGMVLCMHYCATAVIEQHGPRATREAIAAGKHVTTLAFSEVGSRSHFWAPVSTASPDGAGVRLDARKSWATSAGHVDSYVWSSRPLAAEGMSTLWLVPGRAPGLAVPVPFDGLGLRGNASSPIMAEGVRIPRDAMIGADGGGFGIMMGIALPYFQVISASAYLGVMEAATRKASEHVAKTTLSTTGQSLAHLGTVRAFVARMRMKTDMVRALVRDTVAAIEARREDADLRVLEVKAAAGEMATEVTDLAMRVCGGAAFRKEVGVERNFRDARAATVMSPTTDLLYDFIGRVATGLPLFD